MSNYGLKRILNDETRMIKGTPKTPIEKLIKLLESEIEFTQHYEGLDKATWCKAHWLTLDRIKELNLL